MKRTISFLLLTLCFFSHPLHGQGSDSLWRGVYLFGRIDGLNYSQMKDSLHINIMQGATGFGYPTLDSAFLHNPANLRIVNLRALMNYMSSAQRMEYQAERDPDPNLIREYFAERPDSVSENFPLQAPNSRRSVAGVHSAGFMVKSAVPDNEYHYNQTNWWATFRLKIDGQYSPDDTVAHCIVQCKGNPQILADQILLAGDFQSAGTYKDFVLPFYVSYPIQSPQTSPHALSGGTLGPNAAPCGGIDLQVYWYGYVTTYLDKVTVEDSLARQLFAGVHDQAIKQEAGKFTATNYPLHEIFYLKDEPFMSAHLAFNYVGNRIKDTLGQSNPRAGSVTASYERFARFLTVAQPAKVMVDPYFLWSDIPHPSITDNDVADAAGITRWNPSVYLDSLRFWTDVYLHNTFRPAAVAAKQHSKELILIPQLHGIMWSSTHKYRDRNGARSLRPPSPSEIRLQFNIGMAYGAKGFLPYPFGTDYWWAGEPGNSEPIAFPGLVSGRTHNGYYVDHWNNIDTVYGVNIWTGYREKWDELASIYNRLKSIGGTLLAFSWQGAKTWNTGITAGTWSSIVTACSTKDTTGTADAIAFVETGHLQRATKDYLVVVNRRCANTDKRDISLTLSSQQTNWLVTDIETSRAWVVKGGQTFTDRLQPGDGKIYRLEAATVSGATTFSQLKFVGGGVLTLASNANITARSNMDTVNIVLGSNAIFKADTGSTMVIARDSAFVFGSGSTLEIAGLLMTTYGKYTTVPSGSTLRIRPGAVLQCCSVQRGNSDS